VELDAALSAVRAEIAHSREKRAGAVGKVDQLSQDGHSDEERTRSLTRLALEWNAARGLLEAAESKRSAFVGDPSAELAALEAMIEQARQDQTDRLTAEVRAKTRLDGVVANGSYAEFARCDERRLVARQKAESGEHAAEAARILHQAIEAVRAEQRELVLVPVQARASALYARIAGARRADVRFDPKTFVPSGLGFNGQGIIDIGSTLSGGEEEQLHMVARLALADELATGERQFVVLDDSLALTDAVRFARFLAIIEEFSSDRMQFLIMTYDKTRYAALQDATFIDLRALRQGIALASAS
jgi:uncharacterized protein YhaN